MARVVIGLGLALLAHVRAHGFFVCPAPCEAMFLPQDMESTEDCLCLKHSAGKADLENKLSLRMLLGQESPLAALSSATVSYRCPLNSSAKVLHPKAFGDCECKDGLTRDDASGECIHAVSCTGRYALKSYLTHARSIADCVCQDPYTKDDATGECFLDHCPRAANYVKKASVAGAVHSLADCDCLAPFTKNAQSGECFVAFKCPDNSSPPRHGVAKSLADCTCDWGFVRSVKGDKKVATAHPAPYCVSEKPSFVCPPHSRPLPSLKGPPVNFMSCECAWGYDRDEKLEMCLDDKSLRGTPPAEFACPPFSVAMAPHPYSMRQCQCLPGFVANLNMESCDWTPDFYTCPPHAFNPYPSLPALDFADCRCAKGYVRNARNSSCDAKPPRGANGCPMHALVTRWPVHDPNTDCACLYGSVAVNDVEPSKMLGSELQALLKGIELDFENDTDVVCAPPPPTKLSASLCPPNAVMNNWPVTQTSDCSCKSGFALQVHPKVSTGQVAAGTAPTTPDMVCLQSTYSSRLPACGPGMKRSPSDNSCRYMAEEVRSQSKQLGKVVVNGNELDYVLVEDDVMVTQGDIAVGISFGFYDTNPTGKSDGDHHFYILHGYYNMEKDARWKNAKMCYTIDPLVAHRKAEIKGAMEHITTNTGFQFLECNEWYCDDHLDDCDDFVDFTPTESSCYSFVGRVGGRQALGLSNECAQGNLIHLVLHAIGLHHPTVRPDRDAHVAVAWECMDAQKRSFLAVEHLEAIYGQGEVDVAITEVPYDFYSILHHRADAFVNASVDGCLSLVPRIEDVFARQEVLNEMGQRTKMSLTDIHYVWVLYPSLKAAMTTKKPEVKAKNATQVKAMEAMQASATEAPYHESRLHTKADAVDNHKASATNTVGAVVCVVGFLAIVGFALVEMKRVAKRQDESRGKYSDPLLSDPIYD